ncbi:MAG: hypothetical protein H7232_09105 [Aeromicrobium sp.]|nr:hypothetical protein [Burkholderiales bacterium]
MATKRKKETPATDTKPKDRTAIKVYANAKGGETDDEATARTLLRPAAMAAHSIQQMGGVALFDINALITELEKQTTALAANDMARAEATLLVQAHTLDALFNRMLSLGISETRLNQFEAFMRVALKAQSQCRTTLEALAEIKNPKAIAFVKQANIAGGYQQVNNGAPSHAEKKERRPNELLKELTHETVDSRGAAAAGATNSPMETVGAIHRRTNGKGKSKGIAERL